MHKDESSTHVENVPYRSYVPPTTSYPPMPSKKRRIVVDIDGEQVFTSYFISEQHFALNNRIDHVKILAYIGIGIGSFDLLLRVFSLIAVLLQKLC